MFRGDPAGEPAHLLERGEVGGQETARVCRVRRVDPVDRPGAPLGVASDHGDRVPGSGQPQRRLQADPAGSGRDHSSPLHGFHPHSLSG